MRLPDFIIIGAMKSGTSSLHGWLADQPECWLPALKEPNFFSDQPEWNKGLDWYAGLFAKAPAAYAEALARLLARLRRP